MNEWQDLEKLLKQAVEPHLFLPHSLFACGILDPITDAGGKVIREAPLAPWANFRQRALDTAIREINAQTDRKTAGVFLDTLSALAYKTTKKTGEFVLPGFDKLVKQSVLFCRPGYRINPTT